MADWTPASKYVDEFRSGIDVMLRFAADYDLRLPDLLRYGQGGAEAVWQLDVDEAELFDAIRDAVRREWDGPSPTNYYGKTVTETVWLVRQGAVIVERDKG